MHFSPENKKNTRKSIEFYVENFADILADVDLI